MGAGEWERLFALHLEPRLEAYGLRVEDAWRDSWRFARYLRGRSARVQLLAFAAPRSLLLRTRVRRDDGSRELELRFKGRARDGLDSLVARFDAHVVAHLLLATASVCLSDLPPELKLLLASYLEAEDVVRLARVSREWRVLCREAGLWRRRLERDFPRALCLASSWREAYARAYACWRQRRLPSSVVRLALPPSVLQQ